MRSSTLLCLLAVLAISACAHAQYFDFYPHGGDTVSWTDISNWVQYTDYDWNSYPPYDPAVPSRSVYATVYPNQTSFIPHIAYVRDQASVTIGAGQSIRLSELRVGDYTYTLGGSFLPREQSTLLVNGGTLDCTTNMVMGGAYPGRIVQTGSSLVSVTGAGEFVSGWSQELSASPGAGTYRLEGGRLSVQRARIGMRNGNGLFEQTGGTAVFAYCHLGYEWSGVGGTGTYNLSGGTASPSTFTIGTTGGTAPAIGRLNLLGGTVRFYGNLTSAGLAGFSVNNGSVMLGKDFHCDAADPLSDAHYQQYEGTSLTVEVKNAAEFGYLSVAGAVSLDGAFAVAAPSGASWNIGDTFEVLRSRGSNITATPAFLDSYNLISDRYFNLSTDTDGLVLTALRSPGGTTHPHPGDANNDGAVNIGDLGILALNWMGTGKTWATSDFTGDGLVNVGDLGVLALNWGWTGSPAGQGSIPEPASLVLLGLGALAMLRRRR